jgi:predicted MFS family arabinose efflux permease
VIGGALSFRFGWRATFAAMAVLGGLLFGLLLAFLEVRGREGAGWALKRPRARVDLF